MKKYLIMFFALLIPASSFVLRSSLPGENLKLAWFSKKTPEEKAEKKAAKKAKKEEKKAAKIAKKEERKAKKKAKKKEKKIKEKIKAAKKAEKKAKKKVAKKIAKQAKVVEPEMTDAQVNEYVKNWKNDLADAQNDYQNWRVKNIYLWRDTNKRENARDYGDGMYAYLYKLPTWPIEAYFSDHKTNVNVTTKYRYATSAYGSTGSKGDLSKLYFGEDEIRLRNILLVYNLRAFKDLLGGDDSLENYLRYAGVSSAEEVKWRKELDLINFLAESEEFTKFVSCSRYIFDDNVLFGVQVPISYKKHILKMSDEFIPKVGAEANQKFVGNLFQTVVQDVLNLKNLSYNRRSSVTGLGDVVIFANFDINSRFFEKANIGVKLQLPTSKDANPTKLWAPRIGEEFTKFSAHIAALWNYNSWINIHGFAQATYSASSTVNRRVPKKYKYTKTAINQGQDDLDELKGLVLKDKVNQLADGARIAFEEWDTTVPGFADQYKKVNLQQGPEFFARIGNIFEKFLFRRAFLDIYYDYRAKLEDSATRLPEDDWNLILLEENTELSEHNVGFNFAYQFDYNTRVQAGGRYTFAGYNVPQTFELNCSLGIEF